MRPVCHGDVVAAARVLYRQPAKDRAETLRRLIRAAGWAQRFRERYRRAHPFWGDGSLMTVALAEDPPPEPRLSDKEYCRCLALVFGTLSAMGMAVRGS